MLLLCLHVVTILVARVGLQQVVQRVISRNEFVTDSAGFSSGFSSSQGGNEIVLDVGGSNAADGESGGGGYSQQPSTMSQTITYALHNVNVQTEHYNHIYCKFIIIFFYKMLVSLSFLPQQPAGIPTEMRRFPDD